MKKSNVKAEKTKKKKQTELLAWLLVLAVFVVGIIVIAIVKFSHSQSVADKIAGQVNNSSVYYDEIQMYANENKNLVIDDFSKQYNLDMIGEKFWDTEYGETTPRDVLYEKAVDTLVRNKVIQQQAVERGIVAPESYLEMVKALPAEGAGEYGPAEMGVGEYNTYLMSFVEDDLKAKLLEEFSPTVEQERESFALLPDSVKRTDFAMKGYVVTAENSSVSVKDSLQELLSQGNSFDKSINVLQQDIPSIEVTPFEFDSAEIHREDISGGEKSEVLSGLEVGAVAEKDGKVYFVTEKEGGELLTYEQAPNLGRNKWINDAFEKFIEEKVQHATVQLNKGVKQKLQV